MASGVLVALGVGLAWVHVILLAVAPVGLLAVWVLAAVALLLRRAELHRVAAIQEFEQSGRLGDSTAR